MFKQHLILKIGILIISILILCCIAGFKFFFNPLMSFNPSDIPPITASPMNIHDIYAISQFRSNSGHDYSMQAWDGESCRSMKHYFNTNMNMDAQNMPIRSQPSDGHPNINIYAPFDGTITDNEQEQVPIGRQIHIASAQNPSYYVIIFHVDLLPSLHVGSKVTSGQQIGTVGPMDGIDIAYRANLITMKVVYLSIFDSMTPQAFAPFAALGYKPNDFILTRAQADANGYQCNGEQFTNAPQTSPGSPREGVVELRPNPWTAAYDQAHHIGQQTGVPQTQDHNQLGNWH